MIKIDNARELKAGQVVTVTVMLVDRQTDRLYPWRRFATVIGKPYNAKLVELLTLKLHPTDRDLRTVDVTKDTVERLEDHEWPQGVAAMHMKLLAQGVVKLAD